MAQGVGSASAVTNSQDVFGGHLFGAVDYKGPALYVAGGDAIDPRVFGFPNTIVTLIGSADQSNTYIAVPRPLQNGVTGWQLVWRTAATGAEVAANVVLSGITVRLSAIGY
jgi:hypothetical protein